MKNIFKIKNLKGNYFRKGGDLGKVIVG